MTTQEITNYIQEQVIKANPSIVDLVFGCKVEIDTPKRYEEYSENGRETAIVLRFIPTHQNGEDWEDNFLSVFLPEWGEEYEDRNANVEDANDDGFIKIIGRECRLADVLLAIPRMEYAIDVNGYFWKNSKEDKIIPCNIQWNLLADNLELQSEECKEFIYNLLK